MLRKFSVFFLAAVPLAAGSCDDLAKLSLPLVTITRAETTTTATPRGPYCRVAATLTPSSDSAIQIEVWMPVTGWNGKYQAVGNGGWTGSIGYSAMPRR